MIYKNEKLRNISFPIGGIGTGCIGLSGNGELNDWEIFNRPNKNTRNGYSHFAIKAVKKNQTITKVLHGDTNENYIGTHIDGMFSGFGFGPRSNSMCGFPHFKDVSFDGQFPIANLTFTDEQFPGVVKLCAFNPLIPHDDFNSSLPSAFFECEIENVTDEEISYAIAFTVANPCSQSKNQEINGDDCKGVYLSCSDKNADEIGYCDLCILTDEFDAATQAYWYRGGWQDGVTTFWREFSENERLRSRDYDESGNADHCSLAVYATLLPKEKKKIRFVLAWNVPNQYNYWNPYKDGNEKDIVWKNYYATQFRDSQQTAKYALENFDALYRKTETFKNALYDSTLPCYVIDAISSNLSVLKSPTVLRLQDGTFWAWEGCHETEGSCEGTCQHVWNYAYALPFLFPKLERSIRESFTKYALFENGETTFRIPLPVGRKYESTFPCVDGQMGEVIKYYREWKISGDNQWIHEHAMDVFKMLEFAWYKENKHGWDRDKDGVLEGRQHHTLDMELFGPNAWLQGFYLLALDCAAQIADEVGDIDRAEEYRSLYNHGKKWLNENLFNGEYYVQKTDIKDKTILDKYDAQGYWNEEKGEIKYQIGEGCIIDQMLAEWHANIIGLPCVFDDAQKKIALKSLYKYNYKSSMRDVTNMWRNFALNDESGTIICEYPQGKNKPCIPIPYCEETMTGFEYALAGLLLSEGFIDESETLVNAIRERYDGEKRNPWNEIECGSNYARSMAAYALLPIYSGFSFDLSKKYIGFAPIVKGNANFLWSVGTSWGTIRFTKDEIILKVEANSISLEMFGVPERNKVISILVDGNCITFLQDENKIYFTEQCIEKELIIKLL